MTARNSHVPALPRRAFLRGAVGAAALIATPGVLAACGGGAGAAPVTGVLRVGAPSSPTDALNILTSTGSVDYMAMWSLYDPLVRLAGDRVEMVLAESIEPNAAATAYTLRIRDGVHFHSGRPLTAADIAYTLRTLADPKRSPNLAPPLGDLDVANIKVGDPRTLHVPLTRPRADLVEGVLTSFSLVFPDGTTDDKWAAADGTGPYRLAAGQPGGGGRTLERNPAYWGPAPQLERVEIIPIADPTTRLNALRGGEIDFAHGISPAGAATLASDPSVKVLRGGVANSQAMTLEMNLTKAPFTDPNVVLAMKLLVDRQALVDTVLFGNGQPGNDLVGKGLVGYASGIPQRTRDVERARTLLAGAGVSTLDLKVADLVPGTADAAKLIVEQAAAVGLTITLQSVPADTYFADYTAVLSTPFQSYYLLNRPAVSSMALFTGSGSGFNTTGVGGPAYDPLLQAVQATADPAARQQALAAAQRYLWEHGGEIVWAFGEHLDAVVPAVGSVTYNQSLPLFATITMAR